MRAVPAGGAAARSAVALLLVVLLMLPQPPPASAAAPPDPSGSAAIGLDGPVGEGTRVLRLPAVDGAVLEVADLRVPATGRRPARLRLQPARGPVADLGTLDCAVGAARLGWVQRGGSTLIALLVPEDGCRVAGVDVAATVPADHLAFVDLTRPDAPVVVSSLPLEDPSRAIAFSHDGRWAYVAGRRLDGNRGRLQVLDLRDLRRPRAAQMIALTVALAPHDLAVTGDGRWLYASSTADTVLLDLRSPGEPEPVGRIADAMVRRYDSVRIAAVDGGPFGERILMLVSSSLGGGVGCETGTLYVYDITGPLRERPIMLVASRVPEHADHSLPVPGPHPPAGGCPVPTVRVDGAGGRLAVGWWLGLEGAVTSGGRAPRMMRRDHAPYRLDGAFLAAADYCELVPV